MGVEARHAPAKRRLFFTLWPSDAVRERIVSAARPHLEGRVARAVRASNLHLTLAFLGGVTDDAVDEVIAAGDQVCAAPFDLAFNHLETWRAARVACLTIDPAPADLAALVAQLRSHVAARNLPVDQKAFRAHVTLARDWSGDLLDCRIDAIQWPVREFMLAESPAAGGKADYRILRAWSLTHA